MGSPAMLIKHYINALNDIFVMMWTDLPPVQILIVCWNSAIYPPVTE